VKESAQRRVLIVTSSYAPAMVADMHRARHLAWELPGLGWAVEILSPDSSCQNSSHLDHDSAGFFAEASAVHEVPGHLPHLFKAMKMGSIGWRAWWPMKRIGDRLLASGRFDLVYFSTTQFPLFLLGRKWQRSQGVPYILDFHDPCYRENAGPPVWAERSVKHEVSRRLAGLIESRSVSAASGLVAVSEKYVETLYRRYAWRLPPWLGPGRRATIPFGVLPRDLDEAKRSMPQLKYASGDFTRLVYVGAGGPIMERSFALFCRTLAALRGIERATVERIRVELYGTTLGWREGERKHLAEVAAAHGVADLVREDPRRLSYRRSHEVLLESDGALLLGVDDPGYMPSKLFTYAYSGKPLLALVRRDGPAYDAVCGSQPLGSALWFDASREIPEAESMEVVRRFLEAARARQLVDRAKPLEPFLASTMARNHAVLFESCLVGTKE
jgi:hypothetical protein